MEGKKNLCAMIPAELHARNCHAVALIAWQIPPPDKTRTLSWTSFSGFSEPTTIILSAIYFFLH